LLKDYRSNLHVDQLLHQEKLCRDGAAKLAAREITENKAYQSANLKIIDEDTYIFSSDVSLPNCDGSVPDNNVASTSLLSHLVVREQTQSQTNNGRTWF
jgi:hypothetical protein